MFRAALESSPDCVKLLDADGRITFMNANFRRLLEVDDFATVVEQPWIELWPELQRPLVAAALDQARAGESNQFTAPRRTAKGIERQWSVILTPLAATGRDLRAILVSSRDISEVVSAQQIAKAREQLLLTQTASLEAAGHLARFGAWTFDVRTGLADLSEHARKVLGGGPRVLLLEEALEVFEPFERERVKGLLVSAAAGEAVSFDAQARRQDGQSIWLRVYGGASSDGGLRLSGGLQDVTGQKRVELELRHAITRAESANSAKAAFLANIGHETRTPLNAILGMAQVMATDELGPRQRERLAIIREAGASLSALLGDLLALAMIEAGGFELDLHDFALAEVVKETCQPFQMLARQKDLAFHLALDSEVLGHRHGDPLRLCQALRNLISNAVKFTDAGSIHVAVTASDPTAVRFCVSDTGPGIPDSLAPQLFEGVGQGEASRRHGGSGLGLAISRGLVGLMGGELKFESAVGGGAVFTFTLPLERVPGPTFAGKAVTRMETPRPLRILAAEDNPTNRLVLIALLQPFAIELDLVHDGAQAVSAAEACRYDLILMDIRMPLMDGLEATRRIREHERCSGHHPAPIVALSANVMPHQVAEYRAAGMSGAVGKPIDLETLLATIEMATRDLPN